MKQNVISMTERTPAARQFAYARTLLEAEAAAGSAGAKRALGALHLEEAADKLRAAAAGGGPNARRAERGLLELLVECPDLATAADEPALRAHRAGIEKRIAKLEERFEPGNRELDRHSRDQHELDRRMGLTPQARAVERRGNVVRFGVPATEMRSTSTAPKAAAPPPDDQRTRDQDELDRRMGVGSLSMGVKREGNVLRFGVVPKDA